LLVTDSESNILHAVWSATLMVILASILIMTMLIIRRTIKSRQNIQDGIRKQTLKRCFYAAITSPVELTPSSLPQITNADYKIIMLLALDVLRSLRGDDAKKIVRMLELWGLSWYLKKTAYKGNKAECIQALTLLGYFSDEAIPTLLQHVRHKDIYVQIAALHGLAIHKAVDYIPNVIECLTYLGKTNTLILADILQRFGLPAIAPLLNLVQSDANIDVRLAGIMALGLINSHLAVDVLLKIIDDPSEDISAQAIIALGKIGDVRASKAIAAKLESSQASVRVQAAKALGMLRVLNTLPNLAARLSDDVWWVRFRAAESIFLFGDQGIAFLRAISSNKNNAGIIASQVLGELSGVV